MVFIKFPKSSHRASKLLLETSHDVLSSCYAVGNAQYSELIESIKWAHRAEQLSECDHLLCIRMKP